MAPPTDVNDLFWGIALVDTVSTITQATRQSRTSDTSDRRRDVTQSRSHPSRQESGTLEPATKDKDKNKN